MGVWKFKRRSAARKRAGRKLLAAVFLLAAVWSAAGLLADDKTVADAWLNNVIDLALGLHEQDVVTFQAVYEEGNPLAGLFLELYSRREPEQSALWAEKNVENRVVDLVAGLARDKVAAQVMMGTIYRYGLAGQEVDNAEALKWFQKAAEGGNPMAQVIVYTIYSSGDGGPLDNDRANLWLTKAAEQGDARAQTILGTNYRSGSGVERNDEEASRWFRRAAEGGSRLAQYNLAVMYESGRGVPLDEAAALSWFEKAAEQGQLEAQLRVALDYSDGGPGPGKDYGQTVESLRRAAEGGDSEAQFFLGVLYCGREGFPKNIQEGLKWLETAAESGDSRAALYLGRKYLNFSDPELPQNLTTAARWLNAADEAGEPEASQALSLLAMYELLSQMDTTADNAAADSQEPAELAEPAIGHPVGTDQ